ncbi:unnamed protein product [Lactuca saligna]|uniref:MULE transposase domain-containing protein n=1 Tax=Lactuca saligna TaxID=75948 RepID=A0AA36A446_LACSI|nr:unnamed protein product [Lactuca saligna]
MASTSGTKKPKGPKLPEKTYLPDSDSDEDAFDFSFLDFSEETFKAPSRLCDDQLLNLLCDKNVLRRSIDGMVDDGDMSGVQQKEHAHLDEDNEDVGVEYMVHDPNVDWKEMRPRLGDCYESPAQLRDNNDNNKMQCPFRVAAGWKYNERTFQIKFCNEMHLCARNYQFGSLVTSSWLAKHYLKDVIMKPKMTLLEMQADVLQRFSVSVSLGQCQRARATATGMIKGKLEDHYAKVCDYATAIRLSNLGTTCLVGVESNMEFNYFKRFYVGFKAFRDGWSRGCRRVIGLDGSFWKGQVKGEILTAIGRDANNHVYLIAWAIVNVENRDNWTWFIDNLVADLDLSAGTNDEVPKPRVPKRKIGRPRKDGGGQPIFDQFPPVEPAIPRSDAAPPIVSEYGDQVSGTDVPRSDVTPPPVSKSGNQVSGPNISHLKRTKMMARRGGKTKVSGSRNKTPKKTPNGKKHKSNAKEDVSLTCDEDFVDLFTHAPNGKQGMSQEIEDVQEQEHDDNEVKVSERLTLQELLMSGYTHVEAVATMKEVYGEVEEQQIEEKEAEEGVEDREVEEEEVEGIQVEQEEVEGIVVEE